MPTDAVFDSQLITLDGRLAVADFRQDRSSVKLGRGWYASESGGRLSRSVYRWAGREALVYFLPPRADGLELLVRCAPFAEEGLPTQKMTPILNGEELPGVELTDGYQTLRLPLPETKLRPGINQIRFRFTRATRPMDVRDSSDRRPLAALFDLLAIVPVGTAIDRLDHYAAEIDARGRRLLMRRGAVVLLPLVGLAEAGLNPSAIGRKGPSVQVSVIEGDAPARLIWDGAVDDRSARPRWLGARRAAHLLLEAGPGSGVARIQLDQLIVAARRFPERPAKRRPDVFVYMIDTLRADALEPYGSPRPTSPRLAALAEEAVTFTRAWSPAPWTLPATVSVLTGLQPFRHGYVKASITQVPKRKSATIAEILAGQGYDTLGISQTYVASDIYGLDRGFGTYFVHDVLGVERLASADVRWFFWHHLANREQAEKPLFVYLHTVDPHEPYAPTGSDRRFVDELGLSSGRFDSGPRRDPSMSAEERQRQARYFRALYDGEVLHADRELGRFIDLLDSLGLFRQSLLAVLSDHGEEFFEHGGTSHSRTLFEELLHVPLIVRFPGAWRGGDRVEARVSSLDLASTALAAAGVEELPPLDSIDLRQVVERGEGGRRRVVYAETRPEGAVDRFADIELFGIAADDVKCIHSANGIDRYFGEIASYRTYDLATDPGELAPIDPNRPLAERCAAVLEGWVHRAARQGPDLDQAVPVTEEERERLRALGYLE